MIRELIGLMKITYNQGIDMCSENKRFLLRYIVLIPLLQIWGFPEKFTKIM